MRAKATLARKLAFWLTYPFHLCGVVLVQLFMLFQVGFFNTLMRWRTEQPPDKVKQLHQQWLARESRYTAGINSVSVIVPMFNEASSIKRCLCALATRAADRSRVEIIVVDAGCTDNTMEEVQRVADELMSSMKDPPMLMATVSQGGRGAAINTGIREASGDVILMLHADTVLPESWDRHVVHELKNPEVLMTAFSFACDRQQLRSAYAPAGLRLMEMTVNLRSKWYQLPFGDQALAICTRQLASAGGLRSYPILEEYELVNRLRALSAAGGGRIVTLPQKALCSPRRCEHTHMHVHVCVRVHVHMHAHTHMHTHIHMHVLPATVREERSVVWHPSPSHLAPLTSHPSRSPHALTPLPSPSLTLTLTLTPSPPHPSPSPVTLTLTHRPRPRPRPRPSPSPSPSPSPFTLTLTAYFSPLTLSRPNPDAHPHPSRGSREHTYILTCICIYFTPLGGRGRPPGVYI